MITDKDYKNLIRDIEKKTNCSVVSSVSNVKTNGIYISLKYLKRDSIIRTPLNNFIVTDWDFSVIAKGANTKTILNIINLEFRLVEDLKIMRLEEFSITKGFQVGSKNLRYAIIDNDDEAEENEEESGNISYKKNYTMKIMFKK